MHTVASARFTCVQPVIHAAVHHPGGPGDLCRRDAGANEHKCSSGVHEAPKDVIRSFNNVQVTDYIVRASLLAHDIQIATEAIRSRLKLTRCPVTVVVHQKTKLCVEAVVRLAPRVLEIHLMEHDRNPLGFVPKDEGRAGAVT